ncbi:hypothetical protein MUK42_15406 [Musa troglodytarum]|uniref:Uncharacterized protein n=1 Tax=Musa troglodytarum TaxID=320322 RepID=A0A9E7IAF5_9LILI|nr:hypothetical protein MUK42_15406 [Musa troglodytarum]
MTTDAAGQEEEKAHKTGKNQVQRTGEGGSGKHMKDKRTKRKEVALDWGPESQARRRRTADGLTVYSAAELGWGNPDSGGTPLCPVDSAPMGSSNKPC